MNVPKAQLHYSDIVLEKLIASLGHLFSKPPVEHSTLTTKVQLKVEQSIALKEYFSTAEAINSNIYIPPYSISKSTDKNHRKQQTFQVVSLF